jgi:hypothetical protein
MRLTLWLTSTNSEITVLVAETVAQLQPKSMVKMSPIKTSSRSGREFLRKKPEHYLVSKSRSCTIPNLF